jgi:SAM-dependent methyltransferase
MGDISYVDRTDRGEIRKWYKNDATVDIEKIVDIDYVWGELTFKEAVGNERKFDYVIASHVIEHVPDMVGWFKEVADILKPNGILSLVIPDKKYTLDRPRRPSNSADLVDAYLCQMRKPFSRQIFDHFSCVVETGGQNMWARDCGDHTFQKMYNTD